MLSKTKFKKDFLDLAAPLWHNQNSHPLPRNNEYISEFTDLVEHAHKIKPSDSGSHLLATQFIQGISNLYIKSRLRF